MKGQIKECPRPYAYQRAVPKQFRLLFDGKAKFFLNLDTQDHDEAIRRALVAERDFNARCGEDVSPLFNINAVAGLILNDVVNRGEYVSIPVHPSLVDDLLKFSKGRTGYLLDEPMDKYGRRSDAISNRLNSLIDRVTDEWEAREHSYRQSVIIKLTDAGVREELRKALMGYVGGDPQDGYDHTMRVRELSLVIRELKY